LKLRNQVLIVGNASDYSVASTHQAAHDTPSNAGGAECLLTLHPAAHESA